MFNKFDDALPQVLLDVPGCPENLAFMALREMFRQFCRDTKAYRRTVRMTAGSQPQNWVIPIDLSSESLRVLDVIQVRFRAGPGAAASSAYDPNQLPSPTAYGLTAWPTATATPVVDSGLAPLWAFEQGMVVAEELWMLIPAKQDTSSGQAQIQFFIQPPAGTDDIAARVAVVPEDGDAGFYFDADFFADWGMYIIKGAGFKLATMPKKSWTDKTVAELCWHKWLSGIARARSLVAKELWTD